MLAIVNKFCINRSIGQANLPTCIWIEADVLYNTLRSVSACLFYLNECMPGRAGAEIEDLVWIAVNRNIRINANLTLGACIRNIIEAFKILLNINSCLGGGGGN